MKKILWGVIFLSAFYLVSGQLRAWSPESAVPLKVHFLDVGQGDAVLIDYLGGYQVLIDAGPSGEKLLKQLGQVLPPGDKKIEIALLTHPDKDHLAGFLDLLDNFQVDLFLTNGQKADSGTFSAFEEKLKEKEIKRETVYEGSVWSIGRDLEFQVFNPDSEMGEEKGEKNEQSVVLRMEFGQNSFLFAADAERVTEVDLLSDGEIGPVDWLKVAHHGSKNATTEEFLAAAQPEKAIISVGKNSYGHPTQEVLSRLEKAGAEIFRTDQHGTISVFCLSSKQSCQKAD